MNCKFSMISCCLVVAIAAMAGCSAGKTKSWPFAKSLDMRSAVGLKPAKPEPQVPQRFVSTWTDTVLTKPGQKAKRGFGGKLLFFDQESDKPVRVDGQLVVYAFTEEAGEEINTQPTRRYIFPREQFVRHESDTKLGTSYSVWLPWDEVGGEQKNISLIARFEPAEGPLIVGEQTRHLLPGKSAALVKKEAEQKLSQQKVRLAQHSSHEADKVTAASAVEELGQTKERMATTSIPLSKNWQSRLGIRAESEPTAEKENQQATEPTGAAASQPAPQAK